MSKIGHNSDNNCEYNICLLEQKWWAIDRMLVLYDEDDLPGKMYEKLYVERNRVEDLISKLKPSTPDEVTAQLRLAKKIHNNIWGPSKGEEPCPVSKNLSQVVDGVIEMMENLKKEQVLL